MAGAPTGTNLPVADRRPPPTSGAAGPPARLPTATPVTSSPRAGSLGRRRRRSADEAARRALRGDRGKREPRRRCQGGCGAPAGVAAAFRASLGTGAGDGLRTRYLNLGKVALYRVSYSRPLASPMVAKEVGAGDGNRTRVNSLEGCRTTTVLHPPGAFGVVARAGFEPAISGLKGRRPSPLDERARQ